MSLLTLIIVLVAVGVVLWAINQYLPMQPNVKKLLNIVVLVVVVLWLLQGFGLLAELRTIKIGPGK